MTKKKNENLTKSEALAVAWKNRKDYKGYVKGKGSSYNSWRSIVYTGRGQDIGFPAEWKSYDNFLLEVQGEWSIGKIVCRFNTKLPHSKDNSYWSEKGLENSGKLTQLEYEGVTKTLLEWSMELKLNYQGIRQRYFKGKNYSPQEILFGKVKKIKSKNERTHEFRTLRMLGAYRLSDKKKGLNSDITVEYFREQIKSGCLYCGDTVRVGLDRIDNTKGHEKGNVVPCCYECNCARMDNFSHEEMKIIGKSIKEIKRLRNENN